MIIEHNHENEESMTQGHGVRHGIIYVSFDLPIVGIKTYKWDIYGESPEDMRFQTREVRQWASYKANSNGDVPFRVEVE